MIADLFTIEALGWAKLVDYTLPIIDDFIKLFTFGRHFETFKLQISSDLVELLRD